MVQCTLYICYQTKFLWDKWLGVTEAPFPLIFQKYIHSCGAGGIVILCWIEGVLRRPLLGGFKFFHATASPNRPSTNAAYYHFSFFFYHVHSNLHLHQQSTNTAFYHRTFLPYPLTGF